MSSDATPPHNGGSPRRLAAILSADIKDSCRLIGIDEEGTLARMKRYRREIIEPTLFEHYGRVIKNTGDGFLAIFDSPLEAVRCAIVIQQSLLGRNTALPKDQWLQYRIGVNLGDVIIASDDIYGDGVNIAARVQALAQPGSVYISGGVYEQIKNKLVCGYQSLGDERLKNITDPVRIYRVLPDPEAVAGAKKHHRTWAVAAAALLVIAGLGAWYARPGGPTQDREQLFVRAAPQPSLDPQAPVVGPPRAAERAAVVPPPPQPPAPAPQPAPSLATTAPPPPPAPAPQITPVINAPSQAPSQTPPAAAPPAPAQQSPPAAAAPQPSPHVAMIKPPQLPAQGSVPYEVVRDCDQCPQLVSLPGGQFSMGSNDDPTEKPVRQVIVAAFAIGRLPVTIGEWKKCVAAKACTYDPSGSEELPVHNLSWTDAQQYVTWLSGLTHKKYRLPTEAEWEYAGRAGTSTKFWWGNQVVPKMANCKDCGDQSSARVPMKVASFAPNAFGLYDMGGGVAQWVSDCWHRDYQGAPKDGSSWEAPNCRERVLRGGSWLNDASDLRAASRNHYDPNVRYPANGFRIVRNGAN
jgi:formylglycine-generating enzyme required for sulfatase activity/class 3 adenylate cyclase